MNYWITHYPDGRTKIVYNDHYHSDDLHAGVECNEGFYYLTRTDKHGIKHGYVAPYGTLS